jgi:hypothetical protein
MPEFDRRLAGWSFEKKTNMWGLQAADICAYETAKQVLRNLKIDERGTRKSLLRLLKRTEHIGRYYGPDDLDRVMRGLPARVKEEPEA